MTRHEYIYFQIEGTLRIRAICPECKKHVYVRTNGTLRKHGPYDRPCPGSWT